MPFLSRPPWVASLVLLIGWAAGSVAKAAPGGGSAIGWGVGQPPPPASTSNTVLVVAAGNQHSLALTTNQTVIGWGLFSPFIPPGLTNIQAIAAGDYHGLAIRGDRTVVGWGDNSGGQTNVPAGLTNVTSVAAGEYHSLALLANGRVVGWGANNQGQAAPPFELASGLSPAAAIAAGSSHSLAIRNIAGTGRVVGWGNNAYSQAQAPAPLTNGLLNVVAIAAGQFHSLALTADGRVYGWGNNSYGQASPPAGLTDAMAIAAGGIDSLALRSNGTVVAWGYNASGAGAPPPGLSNVTAIAVGSSHRLAVVFQPLQVIAAPEDQTVPAGSTVTFNVTVQGVAPLSFRWQKDGTNIPGALLSALTLDNVQLGDGGLYSVRVIAGNGASTNLSATLTVNSPPLIQQQPQGQTVVAGQTATFQVSATGSGLLRYQWRKNGLNIAGAINFIYSIFNTQASHAGNYDVVVRNDFGAVTSQVAVLAVNLPPVITAQPQSQTVLRGSSVTFTVTAAGADSYQWRKNSVNLPGATSASYTINSAQPQDGGTYQVLVSNAFGSLLSNPALLTVEAPASTATNVVTWGQLLVFNGSEYIDTRAPGGLGSLRALAAGPAHSLALKTDGTVIGWGDNSRGQSAPPAGLSNVVGIAAGEYHSLARRADGTLVGWGDDGSGQTTPPTGLNGVTAIAAGADHSLALHSNGAVIGWGDNSAGQSTPPPGVSNLLAIAAGTRFSLGLRTNRTVTGWGENEYGQTRAPVSLSNVAAIAAGKSHSMALRQDGTVAVWGRNDHGQVDIPPGLSNVVAIAAGANHCLALRADGAVVGWGQNNEGQIETPPGLAALQIAAGGSRSLALKENVYLLQPPQRQPSGIWRLWIRHGDDSPVDASEASSLHVRGAVNPTLSVSNWARLPNPVIADQGKLRIDDNAVTPSKRFYVIVRQP